MAHNIRPYILTGVLTIIPIMVTIFVFDFFVDLLSGFGRPKVILLANAVRPVSPELSDLILDVPWLSSGLAILLTLVLFYALGWAMTRVVGRRLLHALENQVARIPIVTTIYGATKKLIEAFRSDGAQSKKVVLIEFPQPRMKTIGFVTRTMTDQDTGEELAAVYVPTAPNPTSGYLEILPIDELVPLDWTVDEAMTFVVSGGATAPNDIRFHRPAAPGPILRAAEEAGARPTMAGGGGRPAPVGPGDPES